MCRLVERVYINADGHRSKFEDSFPCDKARNGKLCSKAKKRTTEYHTKRDSIPPRGDTPSPVNPPTPTGTGTYLVQQRRPSLSGGRPSTRDGQKSIIIDFGPKSYKSKKYTLGSNKHLSIGATYDDIAVESPGSDASHTIRTGLPEAPLPPQASYDHSDTYSTASNVSHGYYHRHTSSTSTYPESSRIPSLYVTSDTDYDFPTNTRSTKLPPTIHYPSNVSAPSSPGQSRTHGGTTSANHNLTVVTPGYIQEPPLPNTLSALDYQDYADRSGSSHASSGSASQTGRGQASDQPRKKEDGKGRQQEFEAENIKQVRFELRRAEIQTKEQMETLLAEREKQRAAERDEIRRHKEKERKQRERPEEAAAKSRKKERLLPAISNSRFKRTAGSHRESVTMTPAQQDEQRRLLAAELDQIQGESRAAEVREHEEKKAFLQQQQQDPSYYNPRMGGLLGSTALTRRDSQLRRGSISSDARPMLVQSNSRRTSISQPNPSAISTKVAQGLMQPSTRAHAPPPLSFPSNFNTRPTVARRSSFSSQDLPFTTSARSSATNIGNPFAKAASGMLVNSDPWNARNLREALPKEPNLGSGSDKTPSLSSSKKIKSGKESRMGPVLDDSTAPDSKPGVLPRLEVRLRHESGAHDHAQSSKDVPVSTEPIIIPQSPIEIYGHARSRLGDLGTTDDSFQIGRLSELEVGKDATCERRPNSCSSTDATGLLPESVFDASVADPLDTSSDLVVRASQMCNAENWTEQPKVMEPISEDKKSLVLLPTVKSTQASSAHLAAGLKVRADFAIPDGSIADFTETEKSPTSSAGSDGSSYEAFEDCEVHVDDALSSAMGVVKHLLLRELLDHTLLDATDAFGGTNTFTSDGTGSSTSRSFASSSVSSQTPAKGKRSRGDGRNPSDGDGDGNGDGDHSDDEDDGRPKKRGGRGFPDRFPQRRLKCPFYQRHPDKYTKAACRGSGFVDMAKLKDHIKRVHTQPLRCSRCWLEMESDDAYSEHLQQESICKKATEPLEDRIRPQLLKRLEFKKAPYSNAHNVGEKWKMLYKVLFPSDDVIPSPYEQQGMSPQLERALYEALEEELTRELALVIEPIMTKIKSCIPAIIEKCRDKLRSSTPSSDDGLVFTPSSTRSVASSAKGTCVRTTRHDNLQSGSSISPCPVILSRTSVNTDTLAGGGGDSMTQSPTPSPDCFNTIDSREIFVVESCTDLDIQAVNQHDPSNQSHKGEPGTMLGSEQGSVNQAGYAAKPEIYNRTTIGNFAPVPSSQGVVLVPCYSERDSAQQDFRYLSGHQQPDWPREEAIWVQGAVRQMEVAENPLQQTDNSQDWESFMRDFDMNSGRF